MSQGHSQDQEVNRRDTLLTGLNSTGPLRNMRITLILLSLYLGVMHLSPTVATVAPDHSERN